MCEGQDSLNADVAFRIPFIGQPNTAFPFSCSPLAAALFEDECALTRGRRVRHIIGGTHVSATVFVLAAGYSIIQPLPIARIPSAYFRKMSTGLASVLDAIAFSIRLGAVEAVHVFTCLGLCGRRAGHGDVDKGMEDLDRGGLVEGGQARALLKVGGSSQLLCVGVTASLLPPQQQLPRAAAVHYPR